MIFVFSYINLPSPLDRNDKQAGCGSQECTAISSLTSLSFFICRARPSLSFQPIRLVSRSRNNISLSFAAPSGVFSHCAFVSFLSAFLEASSRSGMVVPVVGCGVRSRDSVGRLKRTHVWENAEVCVWANILGHKPIYRAHVET